MKISELSDSAKPAGKEPQMVYSNAVKPAGTVNIRWNTWDTSGQTALVLSSDEKRQFISEIQILRQQKRIPEALEKCREASRRFPSENFFYRIEGDLSLQLGRPGDAAEAYLKNLRLLQGSTFHVFQKSYSNLRRNSAVSDKFMKDYRKRVLQMVEEGKVSPEIQDNLRVFLSSSEIPNHGQSARPLLERIEKAAGESREKLPLLVSPLINGGASSLSKSDFKRIIRDLEKSGEYRLALELLKKMPQSYYDKHFYAAALRLCRRMDDYSDIKLLITIDDQFIENSDFNIQYELTWYFKACGDERVNRVLDKIAGSARASLPIAKTLYNFYLSFNRMDDAQSLGEQIQKMEEQQLSSHSRKRLETQSESDILLREEIQNLIAEREQNRRISAMRELLKGFSHELGQPMSNIRLNIQLYQRKMQRKMARPEELPALFDLVLSQTKRLDYLLKRLNPITSSKSEAVWFGLYECIDQVRSDLNARFSQAGIICALDGEKRIQLWGDPVQFSQVFYNLLLNAMQAMEDGGRIWIDISESARRDITITVTDNGPGIPEEYRQKVFEPFFTTKPPSSDNGGEGLGLYIVWCILQMFQGSIKIDQEYRDGTRFIIQIQPQKGDTA